jgi:GNAT superfamily N-acetyltransferase
MPSSVELAVNAELSNEGLAGLFRLGWPESPVRDYEAELAYSFCWVSAHSGSLLVGFVNVAWNGGKHAFLLDAVVHPDWRQRGVGRALVAEAVNRARQGGLEFLHVDHEARLAPFYQRCGFESTAAGLIRLKAPPPSASANGSPMGLRVAPFSAPSLEPCRGLLAGLPEWFAPSAAAAYTADLARYPSWVATRPSPGAEPEAAVVGCMTLTAPQPGALEVHLLAVHHEHHRQGVGRVLLGVAERFARRAGARILQVKTVGPSSPDPYYARSRAFYQSLGFVPLFETDRLWASGEPALVLVKSL